MAVVTFDPAQFKVAFPEFAAVPDARLTILFTMVGATVLDNTDASIVVDPLVRAPLLDLLVAHMLALYGTAVAGTAGSGPSGVVGRVASATEGSVSTSLEYRAASSATEAWFNQTPYGAMYWAMTAQWRSFRYVALGRSGVGQALDYLNPDRYLQVGTGTNSGTPGGA
jgi:hypothetical protein